MIFVILACFVAWRVLQRDSHERFNRLAVIVLLVTGLVVISAASLPIIHIYLGGNQELRVMPPTAFPFTLQQFWDHGPDLVQYRIVIGWPDGILIYERPLSHEVFGIMIYEHLLGATILAAFLFPVAIGILALINRQSKRNSGQTV